MNLPSLTRRSFLRIGGASLTIAASLGLYTWRIEPHWLELVRRPLPIRNLPNSLAGRTLAQFSDIHLGLEVDDDYLIESFKKVAALHPDIVVITGDLISHHAGIWEQSRHVYQHFPNGRVATLAILGNHDYGPSWSYPEIASGVVGMVEPFGISVLRNHIRDVQGLQIAGLDDLWATGSDLKPALSSLDPKRAALVLSHNPDSVDLPGWDNFNGWILSGHTHGGQCKPPFLPPPLLPVRNRLYTSGEFALAGNRRLYINRGLGHLRRVRFNARPEVTLFELRAA